MSGVNGAGKSTYLKQVAQIVIMAQIGSYGTGAWARVTVWLIQHAIPTCTRSLCARPVRDRHHPVTTPSPLSHPPPPPLVPAHQAHIPVRDRLLSRIGTGDDMESNISTFLLEMRDAAHIVLNAGSVCASCAA